MGSTDVVGTPLIIFTLIYNPQMLSSTAKTEIWKVLYCPANIFSVCINDFTSDSHTPDYDEQFGVITSCPVVVCRVVISSEIQVLFCISFV